MSKNTQASIAVFVIGVLSLFTGENDYAMACSLALIFLHAIDSPCHYKVGDVVNIKGSNQKMVITDISSDYKSVFCQYFDGKKVLHTFERYAISAIEKA
jgi:uncharacterized protein YodC (DUF2158 family)